MIILTFVFLVFQVHQDNFQNYLSKLEMNQIFFLLKLKDFHKFLLRF